MAFSSSMLLADLDYIAPSQACIKPLMVAQQQQQHGAAAGLGAGGGGVYVYDGSTPPPPQPTEIIKISLQDCLACSGCVTTAETMLVTQQSKGEILRCVLEVEDVSLRPAVVVTVSDQTAASIAAHFRLPVEQAFLAISGFCRAVLGARIVSDLRWAQAIALHETAAEFVHRVQNAPATLPLIIAACPGWVCYCEKTHPTLIPYLSPVMSPQAIAGRFIKNCPAVAAQVLKGRAPTTSIYHISVQPCFDKKLEAARSDFALESEATEGAAEVEEPRRDTDCVLSTQELLEWILEVDPALPWRAPLDSALEPLREPAAKLVSGAAAAGTTPATSEALTLEGSGGYHQHVMRHAALQLFGHSVPQEAIAYEHRRNANHRIARLPLPDAANMEFCVAYGFQHIQNIVRGLNRKTAAMAKYQMIEVMACPEGCLNGGGQVRTTRSRETLAQVESAFQQFSEAASAGAFASSTNADDKSGGGSTEEQLEGGGGQPASQGLVFSSAAFYAWTGGSAGTPATHAAVSTQYHDRKKALEERGAQLMHSLKW